MVEATEEICSACGKYFSKNTGSLTQWAFRQEICNCKNGAPNDANASPADASPADASPDDAKISRYESKTPGEIVARHYEVLSCLGEGGMSLVYKARHQYMDKIVAVKVLSPDRIPDAKTTQRFSQEAKSISRLKHENIVDVHEFGIDDNKQPYLIMDFLDGASLAEIVEKSGPIPPVRAASLFLQMADALQHAHSNGVIHRDLKPTNVIVVTNDNVRETVKIVDFGIAKLTEPEESGKALTQTGEVFGSPFYMSPEQCRGHKLDHRSDVYSFGCLMYEVITGKVPAHTDSVVETLMLHISGLTFDFENDKTFIESATKAREQSSFDATRDFKCLSGLKQIIENCVQKNPEDRYQTMDIVRRDLEMLLGGNRPVGGKSSAYSWKSLGLGDKFSNFDKANANQIRSPENVFKSLTPIILVGCGSFLCVATIVFLYRDSLDFFPKPIHAAAPVPAVTASTAPIEPNDTVPLNAPVVQESTRGQSVIATDLEGEHILLRDLRAATLASLKADRFVDLKLRSTTVSNEDLAQISNMAHLKSLDLTGSAGYTNVGLSKLIKLKALKNLSLGGTEITERDTASITKMPLERLDVSYTRLSSEDIKQLGQMKSLKWLKFKRTIASEDSTRELKKHGWKADLDDWLKR